MSRACFISGLPDRLYLDTDPFGPRHLALIFLKPFRKENSFLHIQRTNSTPVETRQNILKKKKEVVGPHRILTTIVHVCTEDPRQLCPAPVLLLV